ncbi:Xaa-Pro dipeptidase [Fluviispira multicolorata]|uniref:Xaa-Pro dipeptidase n=1 Tax=Fluviispira multicolorata TaxID=2654512 RepID=A0A833JDH8_9BACT|nr:Xaa-Pro dipeptidase [Fluviispira multicolorata]KAB8030782.1 Xaa-Pro dipeptidase [Fluviispira multicolorata]
MVSLTSLFSEHIKQRISNANEALQALNYRSLILGAGEPFTYFSDDSNAVFKPNPHFAHWCPAKGAHHIVKYETGKKPLLIYYSPDDFWHFHEPLGNPYWADEFEIIEVNSIDKIWSQLGDLSFSVFVGNEIKYAQVHNVKINCELMSSRLNWYRRFKSNYEIHCISEANRIAAAGHNAAKSSFLDGASEYEIHMSYLLAMESVDSELPYTGIVALDKNGAILHYHGREKRRNGKVLLIDSGATFNNYPSDITRTYANKQADSIFQELLKQTETMQLELCSQVKEGLYFPDLHEKCHLKIAEILENIGVLKISGDYNTALQEGMTKVFFPHGLGHMLGIQVHDIGGKQLDIQGNPAPKNPKNIFSSLRFVGPLEKNVVVTVEPGIYFIPILLNQFRENNNYSDKINWNLIEKLIPFGGIRIEDNVLALGNSQRNLTREFLP